MSRDLRHPRGVSVPAWPPRVWTGLLDPDLGLSGADGATLAEPPLAPDGDPFDTVRLLVRVQGELAGFVEAPLVDGRLDGAALGRRVEHELGVAAAESGASAASGGGDAGLPDWVAATRATPVSVIVCTRDRAERLVRCLDALRGLEHDDLEIIVVDNAPAGEATARLVAAVARDDPRVRYVREDRPGLSCARNSGLSAARAGIVAFTDDDVRVDRLWLAALVRGFAREPHVACVTGLVASASLDGTAARYFDARVSWASSCRRRVFSAARGPGDSPFHPFAAGAFGTGANMAFRTAALREMGGFDERLGAGSPAGGGEDLDAFLRVLLDGRLIGYEPAALVWHEHRAGADALHRQMFDYGKGFTAFLAKHAVSRRAAPVLARRLPAGIAGMVRLSGRFREATERSGADRRAPLWELAGFLAGPLAYWRLRQVVARATRMS